MVIESDLCPPRRSSSDMEAIDMPPPATPANGKVKKKGSVHVQITTPTPTDPEPQEDSSTSSVISKARTRRANSMDKNLLRMGSLYRRNQTMSMAIKAIGDSLVTPLDLNLSPPPRISDVELEAKSIKRNIFRFPSMKKRISKSHSYLAGLGQSLDEAALHASAESIESYTLEDDRDIKQFQRELINLPTFEVDTHKLDQSTSPLLSRSNSVPEHLGGSMSTLGSGKPSAICRISVTAQEETETTQSQPLLALAGQESSTTSGRPELTLPIIPPSESTTENIIVHFAAATPMESPASNIDEPISPIMPIPGSTLEDQLQQLQLQQQAAEEEEMAQYQPLPAISATPILSSHPPQPQLLSVNLPYLPTTTSSPMTLSSTTTSCHSEFTIRTASPANEIPLDHLGVMRAMEMWVRICCTDLESSPQMKREMRDFLAKMSGLGTEHKAWSHRMADKLKLEVCTVETRDGETTGGQFPYRWLT